MAPANAGELFSPSTRSSVGDRRTVGGTLDGGSGMTDDLAQLELDLYPTHQVELSLDDPDERAPDPDPKRTPPGDTSDDVEREVAQ
jgi:hypothetical protein